MTNSNTTNTHLQTSPQPNPEPVHNSHTSYPSQASAAPPANDALPPQAVNIFDMLLAQVDPRNIGSSQDNTVQYYRLADHALGVSLRWLACRLAAAPVPDLQALRDFTLLVLKCRAQELAEKESRAPSRAKASFSQSEYNSALARLDEGTRP